jgi:glycosyltransferase involved in cell wall biosynthesis
VPPAAERPIRARFVHTAYQHWGAHSGYPRFIAHLDPACIQAERRSAADNHDEAPACLRALRPWLRDKLKARPMKWYKVSDLNAELEALTPCLARRLDLVHFLDGEHSPQFLPRVLHAAGAAAATVASFHQPPDMLEDLLDPLTLRRLDHVILMSSSQRGFFERWLPPEKVSVILHGIDTAFFHPGQPKPVDARPRCITAGHWLRDWSILRAVAERLPEVEFHLVTPRETRTEHLANVVQHRGVDDDTLAALYRAADLLFLPLLDSTANNSLLEGLASGLPVVSTDLESVRGYLGGGEAILTPRGEVDAAAAAVVRLLGDPQQRAKMGAAARARAEELSWSAVAAQHQALYLTLAERRRTRRARSGKGAREPDEAHPGAAAA